MCWSKVRESQTWLYLDKLTNWFSPPRSSLLGVPAQHLRLWRYYSEKLELRTVDGEGRGREVSHEIYHVSKEIQKGASVAKENTPRRDFITHLFHTGLALLNV